MTPIGSRPLRANCNSDSICSAEVRRHSVSSVMRGADNQEKRMVMIWHLERSCVIPGGPETLDNSGTSAPRPQILFHLELLEGLPRTYVTSLKKTANVRVDAFAVFWATARAAYAEIPKCFTVKYT